MIRLTAVIVLCTAASVCCANVFNANLIANGDAETNDMTGWAISGPMHTQSAAGFPTLGVPVGQSLDNYIFHGGVSGSGPATSTMSQTVDVSALAAIIDAGSATSTFAALVQSRTDGNTFDRVNGTVQFLSAGSGLLADFSFNDPVIATGTYDWHAVTDVRAVPVGTRSISIALTYKRSAGASTDAYADNLSLVLTPEPASLALLGLGAIMTLRRRR